MPAALFTFNHIQKVYNFLDVKKKIQLRWTLPTGTPGRLVKEYEAGQTMNFLKASRIFGRFLSVSADGPTDTYDQLTLNGTGPQWQRANRSAPAAVRDRVFFTINCSIT